MDSGFYRQNNGGWFFLFNGDMCTDGWVQPYRLFREYSEDGFAFEPEDYKPCRILMPLNLVNFNN